MATKNNKNTKNESMNMSVANGNNTLCFTTYTSEKSGKTIPVVYGFTDKDDERLPYIAVLEQPKAKKGQKVQRVHGPAYGTYSRLPLGKDGERIACVIWGADLRWHDIAKRAAEIINDLDALTQEDYDDLCAKAEAVYEAKKSEGRPTKDGANGANGANEQPAKVQPKIEKKPSAKSQEPKAKQEKPKNSKPTAKAAPEVTLSATKSAPSYTEAALMASFEQLAKAMHLSKDNKNAIENFMKAVIKKAKAA